MRQARLVIALTSILPFFEGGLVASAQSPSSGDPVEAVLARVIPDEDQVAPNALLLGLRRLRDPALRPLFAGLAECGRADLRSHGLLGLAELEDPPRLSLLSVSRLEDHVERAALLGEGLRLELVEQDSFGDILNWKGLEPFLEIVVRGRMLAQGAEPGLERVRQMASEAPDPLSRAMALLLLAQAGESERAVDAADLIASVEGGAQTRAAGIELLLGHIRREELTGAGPFCARLHQIVSPTDRLLALDVLGVWLIADPAEAGPVWRSQMSGASDLGMKLRLSLIGLDGADGLAADLFEGFTNDEEALIRDLMILAQSVASEDAARVLEAIDPVLSHDYIHSTRWCATRATEVIPEINVEIWKRIIRHARERPRLGRGVSETMPHVAESLAESDPQTMTIALSDARSVKDADLAQALLIGVLASGAGPFWDATADLDWPDPASTALARLIDAVHSETLDEASTEALRAVARGRGNLPEVFRVQAAWLSINHSGGARTVLARLLTRPGLDS